MISIIKIESISELEFLTNKKFHWDIEQSMRLKRSHALENASAAVSEHAKWLTSRLCVLSVSDLQYI